MKSAVGTEGTEFAMLMTESLRAFGLAGLVKDCSEDFWADCASFTLSFFTLVMKLLMMSKSA